MQWKRTIHRRSLSMFGLLFWKSLPICWSMCEWTIIWRIVSHHFWRIILFIKYFRCKCDYGWEGDYCHRIVCHHGYTSKFNNWIIWKKSIGAELNYTKCICPPRHTGQFCGECKLIGLHILPFPNCTLEIVPSHARITREKTDGQVWI